MMKRANLADKRGHVLIEDPGSPVKQACLSVARWVTGGGWTEVGRPLSEKKEAKVKLPMPALAFVAMSLLAGGACTQPAPTAPAPTAPAPTAAPTTSTHQAGTEHRLQPKRLEATVEIDMHEMYFSNQKGEKSPTFKLPAGKTVGIHLHNEGAIVHEFAIGRGKSADGYAEVLTEKVPADLFFYYGDVKAEVEDAKFGELEVDPGLRDVWIRTELPAELRGEWEIGCFVEGHYEAGMHATLVIE